MNRVTVTLPKLLRACREAEREGAVNAQAVADRLKVTRDTVRTHFRRLVDLGYLEVDPEPAARGARRYNMTRRGWAAP